MGRGRPGAGAPVLALLGGGRRVLPRHATDPADARASTASSAGRSTGANSPSFRPRWRPPTSAPRRRRVPAVSFARLGDWVSLGRLLYKGTWRSASLAVQFFDGSPQLFEQLAVDEARVLVRFVDALCDRSYDLASHCLSIAPHVLEPLTGDDRGAFLTFAEALASTGWADARSYLEKGPALLAHVQPDAARPLPGALAGAGPPRGRQAFAFFAEAARALSQVDPGVARAAALARRGPRRALAAGRDGVPEDSLESARARPASTRSPTGTSEGSDLLDQSPEGRRGLLPPRVQPRRGDAGVALVPRRAQPRRPTSCACTARR